MGEILLSAQRLTIHHKDTILVTNREGWIGEGLTGLFSRDTRYLSTYRLTLNGFDPRFLGVAAPTTSPRLNEGELIRLGASRVGPTPTA